MDSSARQLEIFAAQDLQRRDTPTTFLDLPVEIRLQIYRLYVPRGRVVMNNATILGRGHGFVVYEDSVLRTPRVLSLLPFTTALLVVCKQVSEECLDVLYGENRFEIDLARGAQAIFRMAFTEQNIRRIKNVHVIARLAATPPELRLLPQPDYQFWAMIFPHLISFALQANEPATCDDAIGARWDADKVLERSLINTWKGRAEPYFELFGKLLGDVDRNIKVGISVGEATLVLAQRHIPGNYPVKRVYKVCICGRRCTRRD